MHTSPFRLRLVLAAGLVAAFTGACMKGPGFMKQGPKEEGKQPATSTEEVKKVILDTIDAGGGAVAGQLAATSDAIQVLQAGADSGIAGSQAEFPPGSVAIDTQVTLGPGVSIATSSNLNSLAIDPDIAASAPSVAISSSVALDTSGFTMQIPVPSGSGLHLQDSFTNLIVIYKVKKAASDNAEFAGVFTRNQLDVQGGFVRFTTNFFGTFQAIITKTLVQEAKEIAAKPEPKFKKTYVKMGFQSSTFGDDAALEEGFLALFHPYSPAKVKADADTTLSLGLWTKRTQEVTP